MHSCVGKKHSGRSHSCTANAWEDVRGVVTKNCTCINPLSMQHDLSFQMPPSGRVLCMIGTHPHCQ